MIVITFVIDTTTYRKNLAYDKYAPIYKKIHCFIVYLN